MGQYDPGPNQTWSIAAPTKLISLRIIYAHEMGNEQVSKSSILRQNVTLDISVFKAKIKLVSCTRSHTRFASEMLRQGVPGPVAQWHDYNTKLKVCPTSHMVTFAHTYPILCADGRDRTRKYC
jgi:hypothetical protein